MMEQLTMAFRQGMREGWTLFWSPFVGAWDEILVAAKRPKAANWKEFVLNDIRVFLAPFSGAVREFTRVVRDILKT